MQSSRDSSVWQTLAATFSGLALGAVGMKLTQSARRPAEGPPEPDVRPLAGRLDQIEQRLARVKQAPAPPSQLDRKVLEAIVGAVEARLHEHWSKVDRHVAALEAKMALEIDALRTQSSAGADSAQARMEEVRSQFLDQMLLLRTAVADELNRFGEAVPALIADRVSAEVGARASALEQAFAARIGAAAAAAAAPGFQESRAPLRAEVAAKERELAHIKNRVLAMNSVHRYAVLLELDGAGLVPRRLLEARTTPLEFPPPAEPDVPEIPLDTLKSWDAYGADRSSGSPRIKAAALLVATMLVCSAAYMWWERPQPQAVAHAVPPAAPRQAAPPPAIATPVTPAAEPALANTNPSTTSSPAKPAAKPRSVAAASRAHRTTRRTKPVRRKGPVPPASLPRVQPTKPTAPPAASPPGGPRDKGTP